MSDRRAQRDAVVRAALEVFTIVFAVLLALWVDQVVKARDDRAQARAVLEDFRAEIEANRETVADRAEYHMLGLGTLDSLLEVARTGGEVSVLRPPLPRGFGFFPIVDTMWETASITDALSLLEFGTVSRIAEVYRTQESISDMEGILLGGAIRPETFASGDPAPILFFILAIMGDMASLERDLDGMYERALEAIAEALGEDYVPEDAAPDGAE